SVTVDPDEATLVPRQEVQLDATARDDASEPLDGRDVTWSTEDDDVVTLSATGLVTALAPGTATITATSEGETGEAEITVVPGVTPLGGVVEGGAGAVVLEFPADAVDEPTPITIEENEAPPAGPSLVPNTAWDLG